MQISSLMTGPYVLVSVKLTWIIWILQYCATRIRQTRIVYYIAVPYATGIFAGLSGETKQKPAAAAAGGGGGRPVGLRTSLSTALRICPGAS